MGDGRRAQARTTRLLGSAPPGTRASPAAPGLCPVLASTRVVGPHFGARAGLGWPRWSHGRGRRPGERASATSGWCGAGGRGRRVRGSCGRGSLGLRDAAAATSPRALLWLLPRPGRGCVLSTRSRPRSSACAAGPEVPPSPRHPEAEARRLATSAPRGRFPRAPRTSQLAGPRRRRGGARGRCLTAPRCPAPAVTRREALASAERSPRLSVLDAKRGSAPASQGQAQDDAWRTASPRRRRLWPADNTHAVHVRRRRPHVSAGRAEGGDRGARRASGGLRSSRSPPGLCSRRRPARGALRPLRSEAGAGPSLPSPDAAQTQAVRTLRARSLPGWLLRWQEQRPEHFT